MSEQTAPLPLFILAVAFLLVWNMDPVSEESSEPSYVEMHYENPPNNKAQTSTSNADNITVTAEEEDVESDKSAAE